MVAALLATSGWSATISPLFCGALLQASALDEVPSLGAYAGLPVTVQPISANPLQTLSDQYLPTILNERTLSSENDYQRLARAFADDQDNHAVVFLNKDSDGRITVGKFHLSTGEVLLTNGKGDIAVFMRLPVRQRALAGFSNTVQILEFLNGRIFVGEDLGACDFISTSARNDHFLKHVVVVPPHITLSQWRNRPLKPSLMPELQRDFYRAMVPGQPTDRVFNEHSLRYQRKAVAFGRSRAPSILSIHGQKQSPRGGFDRVVWRLDVLTGEFGVYLPERGIVLTYFVVDQKLTYSNPQLADHYQLPTVRTPFEYVLSIAQAQAIDQPEQ